jgi:hypothetical protein
MVIKFRVPVAAQLPASQEGHNSIKLESQAVILLSQHFDPLLHTYDEFQNYSLCIVIYRQVDAEGNPSLLISAKISTISK